jgi:hypothetical protein
MFAACVAADRTARKGTQAMKYGDALHAATARTFYLSNATDADHIAAERLLGVRRSHRLMEGLPGADKCHHILAGSGADAVTYPLGLNREYAETPYRHHAFVKRDDNPANTYCVCMNSEKGNHNIHTRCDI